MANHRLSIISSDLFIKNHQENEGHPPLKSSLSLLPSAGVKRTDNTPKILENIKLIYQENDGGI